MTSRRRFLAAAATGAVATTNGCLGFILGEESQTFEASAATVDEAVARQAGYDSLGTETQRLSQTFEVGGEKRTVELVNHLSEYHRTVSTPTLENAEAAVFTVLATPTVEILGETLNPIDEVNVGDLAQQAQGQYEGLQVGEQVDSASVRALGATRDVGQFDGRATLAGSNVDVDFHVANFGHGEDVLVSLGMYPRALRGETERVLEMVTGLTH